MLEIRNLVKTYGTNFRAVDDLSLIVNDGEIFGYIGPNGAGKTTTIKSVMGLINFDSGFITFNGLDVKKYPLEVKKQIAYIPDNPDIYDNLTGLQYLNFIADVYNIPLDARQADIKKYADLFEISSNLGDMISSYSHGMKQKLSLISAFIRHPKLLILDEPFVGLDPKAAFEVKEIMRQMCAEGASVFFSTHVLEVAEKLCDRVGIIKQGKLVAYGKMEDVKGNQSLEEVFLEIADAPKVNE
ncbi:MAG: ABC transporter ATP-binding protein [Bacilli bacterium]|nr:ABC transporter ATP-binding protein [Bacilli bacterium]